MLCLLVTLRVRAGSEAAADECLHALAGHSRREPGCHAYNVHRSPSDPRDVIIYELYDDAAALEAHRASPHFARYANDGLHRLTDSIEARLFDPLTVERSA